MPFVGTQRSKDLVIGNIRPEKVGDLCSIAYSLMINPWRKDPRWTTADEIKKSISLIKVNVFKGLNISDGFNKIDVNTAVDLAWEVFFSLSVLDYERKKLKENGDVY